MSVTPHFTHTIIHPLHTFNKEGKITTNIPLWTDRIICLQNTPIHILIIIKDLFLLHFVSKTERISYIITSQTLWLKLNLQNYYLKSMYIHLIKDVLACGLHHYSLKQFLVLYCLYISNVNLDLFLLFSDSCTKIMDISNRKLILSLNQPNKSLAFTLF